MCVHQHLCTAFRADSAPCSPARPPPVAGPCALARLHARQLPASFPPSQEYTATHDVHEAERCLSDLAVPHFHHEFVVRLVCGALAQVCVCVRTCRLTCVAV